MMWTVIDRWLEQLLVPVLQSVLDPWHTLLNAMPSWVWRLAVCVYLVAGCLWVVFLRRSFIFAGAPDEANWRDLRRWVPLILLPYLLIYLIF